MTNDLIERSAQVLAKLLAVESGVQCGPGSPDFGGTTNWYRNPDGPEAAAHIEALAERIRELEGALERADAQFAHLADLAAQPDVQTNNNGMALSFIFGMQRACRDWKSYRARQARKDKENG